MLSALRDGIQRELSAQLGRTKRTFRLWQDLVAIAPGKLWESEIKTAIDGSFFFIPIVTPRSVSSKYCKFEFDNFLAREKAIGRNDLIFPILYISVAALENEAKWRDDAVLSTIGRRQYVDWRPLRHFDVQTTAVREQIARLCQKIVEALNEPWAPPEERRRIEETEACQRAEEEARRLEAEAKRRAKEEQHRKQEGAKEDERRRQETEAKLIADEEERRQRAEAELRAEQERVRKSAEAPNGGLAAGRWRVRAAIAAVVVAALLLIGVGGYAFLQEREARAAIEAQVKSIREQAEQQRRDAFRAEQERQEERAAAEAKHISEQAERQRRDALGAEQDRKASAAAVKEFESAGFEWLSPDQKKLLLKAIATIDSGVDQIFDAEQIKTFPAYWPQIGRRGDLIFIADERWLSRFPDRRWSGPRFSEAMKAFLIESRPNIRAFTLSAEGFELLKSFPSAMSPNDDSRFSTIPWSAYIKVADLPL